MTFRRAAVLGLIAAGGGAVLYFQLSPKPAPPIRVGILHSFSGTMAGNEENVAKATLLALEANASVLGRRLEPVVADGGSDPARFAKEAERLIVEQKVSAIFGCWTSASRKAVRPVVEKHHNVLFYPVQYEGLEESPNIVYTGAAPNQQIIPAVSWCLEKLGHRFTIIGSDYVFPRTAGAIIKDHVASRRGAVVGERYVPLGEKDFSGIVEDIKATMPVVVLNTINGESNTAFFAALKAASLTPERLPTMSFSVSESEVARIGVPLLAGHYVAWNYLRSLETPENRRFVEAFREKHGAGAVTDDPSEAAYFGVHLWLQAVRDAGSVDPLAVLATIGSQSYAAPEGLVHVDAESHHTWKTVRVARVDETGRFREVWSSETPTRPAPFPLFRTREAWNAFLSDLEGRKAPRS